MIVDLSANLRCLFVINDHCASTLNSKYIILQMEIFKTNVHIKAFLAIFFRPQVAGNLTLLINYYLGNFLSKVALKLDLQ